MVKGIKPRTHLLLDTAQFALLISLVLTGYIQHYLAQAGTHIHFMFHALHEASGICLCLTVGLHLYLHLPWIQAQLSRMAKKQAQP